MKNSAWSSLTLIALVLLINVGRADAVPDIRGEYSGSYTIIVSNCSDSSLNGTYTAILALGIPAQTGNAFSGSATGTFNPGRSSAIEYIQLSGTITESGQISGNTSHTFFGPGGVGTFTGQLSGNTLSIENPGHDTEGETCTYIRYMSATRLPSTHLPSESKILASDGTAYDQFGWNVSISGDYAIVGAFFDGDNGFHSGSAYIFERSGSSWNQVAKLTASDGAAYDEFGVGVSIFGDYAIVGAPGDDDNEIDSGSAYVFERSGNTWNEVAKLNASDGAADDYFGGRISISGGYAIVSATGDDDNGIDSGSAYIFERSGSTWNQVAKLTASDGTGRDHFGFSVSISGDYAIVSASFDGDIFERYSGSAYIFERSGSSWNQVAKLTASDGAADDYFGMSVSISGGYAIVGAVRDDDHEIDSGSAYIFERSGSSWNQVAKLTASDGAANDYFGVGVSIYGGYAIVGARGDSGYYIFGDSAAYIFERSGSSWNQVAKLIAGDGTAYDQFGNSVSISGDYAIVGASWDDDKGFQSGSAYIFDFESPSLDNGNDVIIDFGPSSGTWVRYNNASWTKLHPGSPEQIATGDMDGNALDEVILDFASSGVWTRINNSSWSKLHPSNPDSFTTGDMDGGGQDDVIIDFGSSGIWVRMNNASWVKLHPSNPDSMTTGDMDGNGQDDIIIDFGSSGIWVRMNNASWTKLHPSNPDTIARGDIDNNGKDDVIIDFGSSGIWVRMNNSSWTKLHPSNPDGIYTGDMDGTGQDDVIIDFGNSGIWVRMNGSSWTKLHPSNPDSITTGDMDGSGQDDVIIDFPGSGMWVRYNDTSWTKLHPANCEQMATGDIDGN